MFKAWSPSLFILRLLYSAKHSSTLSAIISAMASEEVAAGEGAFLTWSTRLPRSPSPPSNTKSSTRFPFRSSAWARTPEGPLRTSLRESSGMYFWRILTCAPMKSPLYISPTPYVMFLITSFWRPLKDRASVKSRASKSYSLYPSLLKASTAFGPSQILPSILGVKWTPRNGNRGSGTG